MAYLVCATRDAPLEVGRQGHENGVLGRNPEIFQGDVVAEVLVDVERPPVEICVADRHTNATIVRVAPSEGR